jgi:hypothetical protein
MSRGNLDARSIAAKKAWKTAAMKFTVKAVALNYNFTQMFSFGENLFSP